MALAQGAQNVNSALPGQCEIKEQNVAIVISQAGQTLFSRRSFESDGDAQFAGQHLAKAGTDDLMVIDDGNLKHGKPFRWTGDRLTPGFCLKFRPKKQVKWAGVQANSGRRVL